MATTPTAVRTELLAVASAEGEGLTVVAASAGSEVEAAGEGLGSGSGALAGGLGATQPLGHFSAVYQLLSVESKGQLAGAFVLQFLSQATFV